MYKLFLFLSSCEPTINFIFSTLCIYKILFYFHLIVKLKYIYLSVVKLINK